MGAGADAGYFGGVPQGRRCLLFGGGNEGGVRPTRGLFQERRRVHAVSWWRKSATPSSHTLKHIGMIKSGTDERPAKGFSWRKSAASLKCQHGEAGEQSGFPDKAVLCSKCSTKAMVLMDGCMTCLNCGESKCG